MDKDKIEGIVSDLILSIGEDITREGLIETPKRVANFYSEFLEENKFNLTTFSNEGYDEMITQFDIPFYSLCEHHLLPFFGVGHIAYIPRDKIVGLSKLSRTLDHFSHRPQNQERITTQVAQYLEKKLNPQGIAVVLTARHMCMEMRGTKKIGTETTTSALTGVFNENPSTRSEFYLQINRSK